MTSSGCPEGYIEQTVSSKTGDSGAPYISERALKDWANKNRQIAGPKFGYKILGEGVYLVYVKSTIPDKQILDIKKASNPDYYDRSRFYEE